MSLSEPPIVTLSWEDEEIALPSANELEEDEEPPELFRVLFLSCSSRCLNFLSILASSAWSILSSSPDSSSSLSPSSSSSKMVILSLLFLLLLSRTDERVFLPWGVEETSVSDLPRFLVGAGEGTEGVISGFPEETSSVVCSGLIKRWGGTENLSKG